MSICCFFGHRDTPYIISDKLESVIINLIENKAIDTFYIGHQGNFDAMVRSTLKKLKKNILTSITVLYLHIYPEQRISMKTIQIQYIPMCLKPFPAVLQ